MNEIRSVLAVFKDGELHTWTGYGPDEDLKALAELGRNVAAGLHVALYLLKAPDLESDALYDWIDHELTLAPSGLHDERFSTWLERRAG